MPRTLIVYLIPSLTPLVDFLNHSLRVIGKPLQLDLRGRSAEHHNSFEHLFRKSLHKWFVFIVLLFVRLNPTISCDIGFRVL